MKAKIKKTGEIVNIAEYATIELEMCDSYGDPICLAPEDIELIQEQTEDEHWNDIRERTAIAAMQGLLANNTLFYNNGDAKIGIIDNAIKYSNKLIEEHKKK